MDIVKTGQDVFHELSIMDCITKENNEIVKNIIEACLKNSISKEAAEKLVQNKLSKWHSFPFLLIKDIFNLCDALSNKPIPNSDLGYQWFSFQGANLTDSRPLCIAMKKRRFFHIYEIDELINGIVDGEQIPITNNGLPEGLFPCTNTQNYLHLLNGRSCGHTFGYVHYKRVPEELRNRVIKRLKKLYPQLKID